MICWQRQNKGFSSRTIFTEQCSWQFLLRVVNPFAQTLCLLCIPQEINLRPLSGQHFAWYIDRETQYVGQQSIGNWGRLLRKTQFPHSWAGLHCKKKNHIFCISLSKAIFWTKFGVVLEATPLFQTKFQACTWSKNNVLTKHAAIH